MTARVAILVAFYNDGRTFAETLDSLRREPDVEFVVVDDGSTDQASLDLLETIAKSGVAVVRQENAGPSAAWMAGLRVTTASYVMPFSSDDILLPGATALLANSLDADQDAAFAWGDTVTFGLARAYRPSVPTLDPWLVTFANCMPAYSLFRRSALLGAGGWEAVGASEDWDLWMRLAAQGVRGIYVPRPIYRYRRGTEGRFWRHGSHHETLYAELRERNLQLFDRRITNRAASPAPTALKALIPLIDKFPGVPRLKKIQLSEGLTLLFWSGGLRLTLRIVGQGIAFRLRVMRNGE